jgi:adenylate cyclase
VIALQGEVTQAIAREIRVSLTPAEQMRLAQPRPVSPEAYEAFLKGVYFVGRLESPGKSAEYFQQAISKDPNYAPAYVGLAISYPPGAGHEKALPMIKKALQLDDTLAEAHAALAAYLEDTNRDWAGAEREYLRALELDPGNARAHHWYSMFLLEMGRLEEALAENRHAVQLHPTGRFVNAALAVKLIDLGRYGEAVAQAKACLEMDTNSPNAHFALGLAYSKKGIREQAISELKRAVALAPDYSGYMGALAYVYAVFGQTSDACRVAEEMKELATRARVGPSHVATAYASCGRNGEAFHWLERAYREHDPDSLI